MEQQAQCHFCGKISKTTENQTGWIAGCDHAESPQGLGNRTTPADEIIRFFFSRPERKRINGEPVKE